jgi:hypothetical protein
MFTTLKAFLDRFLLRNILTRPHFLSGYLRNPISKPCITFDSQLNQLRKLLETHDETSGQVTSAIKEMRSVSRLPLEVVPKGVWPIGDVRLNVKTHLKSTFADAVALLNATGRNLSPDDEKYLRLLLTHGCGWSATYPSHMNDPWVQYFHEMYPQLEGLVPILDSMTYLEELRDLPDGHNPNGPSFFLLATANSYFVFDFSDGEEALFEAGESLKDVYLGMRDWRWAEVSDNPWEIVDYEEWINTTDYFPVYRRSMNGEFCTGGIRELKLDY